MNNRSAGCFGFAALWKMPAMWEDMKTLFASLSLCLRIRLCLFDADTIFLLFILNYFFISAATGLVGVFLLLSRPL